MINITASVALDGLERAVQARGEEFLYVRELDEDGLQDGCKYLHTEDGKYVPGCMVGWILLDLGVPTGAIERYNSGWDVAGVLCRLQAIGVIEFEDDAVRILQVAQSEQDSDRTWGVALAAAKERAQQLAEQTYRENYAASSAANPL